MLRKGLNFVFFLLFFGAVMMAQQSEWRDYLEKKQYEKIVSQACNLKPADTTDFVKMYQLGQAYEGVLRYKDAYNFYKRCFAIDSSRMDMLNTLARLCANLGKVEEAEDYYQMVLESDSLNFYAKYQLARLYVSRRQFLEALLLYDNLLKANPDNMSLLWAKGDCYLYTGSLLQAFGCHLTAYMSNVENANWACSLINTMLQIHSVFSRGESSPDEGDSPTDQDVPASKQDGTASVQKDPVSDQNVSETDQDNSLSDQDDSELYQDTNFVDEAMAICDTALFYNPGHIELRQRKAMIFYQKKEFMKADSVYTGLLADKDSSIITLKYCGYARYHAQKWYDAIEPLEKAHKIDREAYDIRLFLGISLGRTYDTKKAFEYFDEAEKLLEPNPVWIDLLARFRAEIYIKTGNTNKGAELLYQLWKKGNKQIALLQRLQYSYDYRIFPEMPEDERQRFVFITFLYVTELLERRNAGDIKKQQGPYLLWVLKKFEEDMFFRSVTSLPMLSPDNKKTTLSRERLKELIKLVEN
jgi:tetratricopeptide (TPR) repeat protein